MKELIHGLIRLCFVNIAIFYIGINGQSIVISPYNQTESYSGCTVGVLANADVITIKGEAFFPENYTQFMLPFITFYKNVATGNSQLCLLDISNSQKDNNCSIQASAKKNVYRFLIALTAAEELSEGKIIGSLLFMNSTKVQHEMILPKIYRIDPSAVATLTVNGEKAKSQCNITVTTRDLKIEASCETLLKPCHLQINYNDTEQVKEGDNSVSFEKRFENSVNMTVVLRSTLCKREIPEDIFHCTISIDLSAYDIRTASASSLLLIIGLSVGITVVCIIIALFWYKTCGSKCIAKTNQDSVEANHNRHAANEDTQECISTTNQDSVNANHNCHDANEDIQENSVVYSPVKKNIALYNGLNDQTKSNRAKEIEPLLKLEDNVKMEETDDCVFEESKKDSVLEHSSEKLQDNDDAVEESPKKAGSNEYTKDIPMSPLADASKEYIDV